MRILTIEDDRFFQKFYATKLLAEGFEVEVAGDGEDGLQKAKTTTPDLILLDMIMPKKDGFEVLDELKKSETLKNVPVLVFSTLGQENDIQRALTLGASGYVNKTLFDYASLLVKINSLIKK